ncbi:inorganic phosphate transporter [Candidatus Riflebacteria bacterium]
MTGFFLISGIFMGWGLGANDSANIFGTGVASGTIRYRTAIILTAIFVLIGAVVEGPKCMDTVGKMSNLGMREAFAASLAAAITIMLLTVLALPASTSQAIMGAVVGLGLLNGTFNNWGKLTKVIICWIFTPIGGMVFSIILYKVLAWFMKFIKSPALFDEIIFLGLLLSGCYGSYALGANNVANTTGVFVGCKLLTPFNAALIGGISIAFGALTYSKNVMMTIGKKITTLDNFSAFVAVLAEAITVHIYTLVGVPVSTSQAIVGCVIGIGILKGTRTVQKKTIIQIFVGWFATPLFAAILAVVTIKLMLYFFS